MTRQAHCMTRDDLTRDGLSADDVAQLCPWATEYIGLDGQPCWLAEDLVPLLREEVES